MALVMHERLSLNSHTVLRIRETGNAQVAHPHKVRLGKEFMGRGWPSSAPKTGTDQPSGGVNGLNSAWLKDSANSRRDPRAPSRTGPQMTKS